MGKKPHNGRSFAIPAKRISRLGHISAMAAGVAGNMAMGGAKQLGQGQRPVMKDLLLTPSNITRITEHLSRMRGAAMKIGQFVSMDQGDFLPPELAQIMARLRDDAYAMPPAQLKKVLNTQLPENWLRSFSKFDVHPIAAASIGQVHRALLKDGRDLAMKIQYPGVANSIDSDVANVGVLIKMSGLLPKGFALAPYLEEARKQLHDETDYLQEAAQQMRFKTLLADTPHFTLPQVHADWTSAAILAMDYIAGIPIEDAISEPQDTRNRIAHDLTALTLRELFDFGLMQTDPNFANYLYDPATQNIVLLDFGAARDIAPQTAAQYRDLLRAGLNNDPTEMLDAAQTIGFIGPDTSTTHRTQILHIMQLIFGALQTTTPIDFRDQILSRQIQSLGLTLMNDGFMPPVLPIDVLLVQRKFAGVFLLAARLGATVDVAAMLDPYTT